MARFVVLKSNRLGCNPLQMETDLAAGLCMRQPYWPFAAIAVPGVPQILANGILRGFVFRRFERDNKTDGWSSPATSPPAA
jgi:hypothetical protein